MLDADLLNDLLPQTQCTRCGYPDCRHYAEAIAQGEAEINQCPPGGLEGVERLARATGRPVIPLNPHHGEAGPRHWAVIDEDWCIGCTLCIKACPVDCISLVPVHGAQTPRPTGWAAWSAADAEQARERYAVHQRRLVQTQRDQDERLRLEAEHTLADLPAASRITDPAELDKKRAIIEAALARARARR